MSVEVNTFSVFLQTEFKEFCLLKCYKKIIFPVSSRSRESESLRGCSKGGWCGFRDLLIPLKYGLVRGNYLFRRAGETRGEKEAYLNCIALYTPPFEGSC